MKLCIVSPSYPSLPAAGGIAVYTQTAAQALAKRGHQVHVLVGLKGVRRDFADGDVAVHVRPVRWLPVVSRWLPGLGESICLAWHLWRLQRRYRFDLVEFPNWEGPGLVATALRFVPTVVRLHTSTWESLEIAQRAPTRAERFLLWAEKTSARRAHAVVTHSESHRRASAAHLGLPAIELIPHGIPLPEQPTLTATEESAAVLTVGFLNSRKGTDVFLAAVPLVLAAVPAAMFWVVGGDPHHRYETAFRAAHPPAVCDRVKFLGYVEPEELSRLYGQCAVYASASRYESFGLTFVEAMARGKPVVGCRAGAITELIETEVTGLLATPGDAASLADAMIRLLRDAPLRQRLGEAGRRRFLERYTAEQMAERIEAFYQQVLAC